jgi:hypothetical protein
VAGATGALAGGAAVGEVMVGAAAGRATFGVTLPLPQVAVAGFRERAGKSSSSGSAGGVGASASSALGKRGPV